MNQLSPPRRIVSFGVYRCDLRAGELYKRGLKVRLANQPFRLLTILLERPGEVVSREELREQLWSAETFVDFDDGLNTAINKLRAALDDQADNPRFIETIPRRGYRFIGSIEPPNVEPQNVEPQNGNETGNASTAPATQEQALPPDAVVRFPARFPGYEGGERRRPERGQMTGWFRRWQVSVPAGAAIAAAAFALWWYTPLPPPQVIRTDQITSSARIDTITKPASDGQRIYYMQRAGDHWNLMQTSLRGGDGRRLEAPGKNAMVLDVSADASEVLIASFERRDGEKQLWMMPAQGGAARRLGNANSSFAAISPDGKSIAYMRDTALWMIDADGANARKLADLPGPASWLAWSPEGGRLRFTLNVRLSDAESSLWEISSKGDNLHRLLSGWTHPSSECCGAWTPDGRYFIFTATRDGQVNLWVLRERGSFWRRSPRGPFQLTFGPNTPLAGTPSPDGKRIFYYNGLWREELQRLDLKTGHFSPLLPDPHAQFATFSRDGKWMAYVDPHSGGLIRSRADGTERLELAGAVVSPSYPRWSPDGKWIVFGAGVPGRPAESDLVAAEGGQLQPLLASQTGVRDADWSNDGKRLVTSRWVGGSDERELVIVSFETRRAERIPGSERLAMSRWSPDGGYISATVGDQSQLKLWDLSARQWRVIARGTALGFSVWSPDSRYLYFQDLLANGERVYRYDVKRASVAAVAEFSEIFRTGVDRCALYGVTPDGSPIMELNRSAYDLFAAEVRFP
jgi:Tol biopolymer transport system component/DNA-binding winged helix-turn-helix (wHTH) protein